MQKRRLNRLESIVLNETYSKRLLIHSEYMGLLTREKIYEELYEMYPDWLYLEEKRLAEMHKAHINYGAAPPSWGIKIHDRE